VSPNGNTTTTAYDTFGDKASVTDPMGDKTATATTPRVVG